MNRCLACGLAVRHHFDTRNRKVDCAAARRLHPRAKAVKRKLRSLLALSRNVALLLAFTSSPAAAQSLTLPTVAWAVAGTADVVTTAQGGFWSGTSATRETNPLINWIDNPKAMLAFGVAVETTAVVVLRNTFGKRHPRWAAVILYSAASVHAAFAVKNHRLNRRMR